MSSDAGDVLLLAPWKADMTVLDGPAEVARAVVAASDVFTPARLGTVFISTRGREYDVYPDMLVPPGY